MLFSSVSFLFMFLPSVLLGYFLLPIRYRNSWLLLASIFFYAWGEPTYVLIMLCSILINYTGARLVAAYRSHGKLILGASIVADLGILFYFKYFNFVVDNINQFMEAKIDFVIVVMPIGISFYTFQAISYLVDVYRGEVEVQKNLFKVALYITLFPQLIAGPIVKYHDVAEQISERQENFPDFIYGLKRFIIGLSKKMLLANPMGAVADNVFSLPVEQMNCLTSWVGAVCYTLQIFFDFSGYSDMAIGLGRMFGFKFLENFNYPYISKSITEFWRRWHISLSTWFKEYLYIPLGGNRVSKFRNYINLFIVFFATGFWHGAAWNFIFWGLWHGIFIVFEKITGWHKNDGGPFLSFIHHFYTLLIVVIGWVMFRADTMTYAGEYIKNMFGQVNGSMQIYPLRYYFDSYEMITMLIALLVSTPLFSSMLNDKYTSAKTHIMINLWILTLFILSAISVVGSTYNPFIYFRF